MRCRPDQTRSAICAINSPLSSVMLKPVVHPVRYTTLSSEVHCFEHPTSFATPKANKDGSKVGALGQCYFKHPTNAL